MNMINVDCGTQCLREVMVGEDVRLYNFVNAYQCVIDDGSRIGAFVEIQKNVRIGKNCKISSHSFLCEGVEIKDRVFVGHNVSFINDRYPRATNRDGTIQTERDWKVTGTVVEEGASIGTGSTILCGVTIGRNAIVGAGSVVTKDIPENAVACGNPARVVRYIDEGDASGCKD